MKTNFDRAICMLEDIGKTNRAIFIGPFILLFLGRGGAKPHVKLEVHAQTDGFNLAYIENLRKRGGWGKKAMQMLCSIADMNSCPIRLTIDTGFGCSADQLKKFYSQFGFKFKGRHGYRGCLFNAIKKTGGSK